MKKSDAYTENVLVMELATMVVAIALAFLATSLTRILIHSYTGHSRICNSEYSCFMVLVVIRGGKIGISLQDT